MSGSIIRLFEKKKGPVIFTKVIKCPFLQDRHVAVSNLFLGKVITCSNENGFFPFFHSFLFLRRHMSALV